MKLGARILKTGIAIILALLLAEAFSLPSPVFAGIAAIFAIQPTIYRSYLTILEQIQGNLIGAITAILFVQTLGNHVLIIGFAAIVVISLHLKLKLTNTISLSLVTMIVIMEVPQTESIEFGMIRFLTIMLGVFSAFIVNLIFIPPKYENKLYNSLAFVTEEITKWIRINTHHASEHVFLKRDIEKINEELIKIEQLYLMYKEERGYFNKTTYFVKARKLVIYRQMIATTKKSLEILRRLHRFENEIFHLPDDFHQELQQTLNMLIDQHEQVMLKYIGKVRQPLAENKFYLDKKNLFNKFIAQKREIDYEKEVTFYRILQLISTIIEYDEQIEHLDRLINSFKNYHKSTNKIVIKEQYED